MTDEVIETENKEVKADTKADFQEKIELRDVKHRAKLKVVTEELETVKAKTELEKQELSSKIEAEAKRNQSLQKKLMETELKAQAVAAGITDIDFVKLIDSSSLTMDENGNVIGIEKVLSEFKAAKPNLFEKERIKSSTTGKQIPKEDEKVTLVDAFKLSNDEFEAQKAALLSGKRY